MGGWPGGVGEIDNKANSVQLQLQLPTRTELGNNSASKFYFPSVTDTE